MIVAFLRLFKNKEQSQEGDVLNDPQLNTRHAKARFLYVVVVFVG